MVYAYLLENTRSDVNIDNAPLLALVQEYEVEESAVHVDPLDSIDRHDLVALIGRLESGDALLLRSVGDLSNNITDLIKALTRLHRLDVEVITALEPEYDYILYQQALFDYQRIERQWKAIKRVRGIDKAKAEGRMGRKTDRTKVLDAIRMYQSEQFTIADIRRITGVASSTLYRALKGLDRQ